MCVTLWALDTLLGVWGQSCVALNFACAGHTAEAAGRAELDKARCATGSLKAKLKPHLAAELTAKLSVRTALDILLGPKLMANLDAKLRSKTRNFQVATLY